MPQAWLRISLFILVILAGAVRSGEKATQRTATGYRMFSAGNNLQDPNLLKNVDDSKHQYLITNQRRLLEADCDDSNAVNYSPTATGSSECSYLRFDLDFRLPLWSTENSTISFPDGEGEIADVYGNMTITSEDGVDYWNVTGSEYALLISPSTDLQLNVTDEMTFITWIRYTEMSGYHLSGYTDFLDLTSISVGVYDNVGWVNSGSIFHWTQGVIPTDVWMQYGLSIGEDNTGSRRAQLFINGSIVHNETTAHKVPATLDATGFGIMCSSVSSTPTYFTIGNLARAQIHNKAFTPSEIVSDFEEFELLFSEAVSPSPTPTPSPSATSSPAYEWWPLGVIHGEAAGDTSGTAVAMNFGGDVIAIGAPENDGNGTGSGHVQVFQYAYQTGSWTQLGSDLDGENAGDKATYSVALNVDGDIVAFGGHYNNGNGTDSGHVRVYQYTTEGETWLQLGSDIDAEAAGDGSGRSVALNNDGDIVAVGAPYNAGGGADSGHVRVYQYNGTTDSWEQLGEDIDGEAGGDHSGWSVALNSFGDKIAIGAPWNDGNGADSGHVRVYEFNSTAWVQIGSDIDGESAGDASSFSVAMNGDGNIVAAGTYLNDGNGADSGHVRVYQYNAETSTWTQLGSDIDGEAAGDGGGRAISLNNAGDIIAVGGPYNTGNGLNSGHVRLYKYNAMTTSWYQLGSDINGSGIGEYSGWEVALNGAGTMVVVGAPWATNASGDFTGATRVYGYAQISASPAPSPTSTASTTGSASRTSSPSASASSTSTPTSSITGSATASKTSSSSPSVSETQSESPSTSGTRTPSISASPSQSLSRSASSSPRKSSSPTASGPMTASSSVTTSATVSRTISVSQTASETASGSGSISATQTSSAPDPALLSSAGASSSTESGSVSSTSTSTATGSTSVSISTTVTQSSSGSSSGSASMSASVSQSISATLSSSQSGSSSPTSTGTMTQSPSGTSSGSTSMSVSVSQSITATSSSSQSGSSSPTSTGTMTQSPSGTSSRSTSISVSIFQSISATSSSSQSGSSSPTSTGTMTQSPSGTSAGSTSISVSISQSISATSSSSQSGSSSPTSTGTMTQSTSGASSGSTSMSVSISQSISATSSSSQSGSSSPTSTGTMTQSPSGTSSGSGSVSPSSSSSVSQSISATLSSSQSGSSSPTSTGTMTQSPSGTSSGSESTSPTSSSSVSQTISKTVSSSQSGSSSPTSTGTTTQSSTATLSTSGLQSVSSTLSSAQSGSSSPTSTGTTTQSSTGTSSVSATLSTSASQSVSSTVSSSQSCSASATSTGTMTQSSSGTSSGSESTSPTSSSSASQSISATVSSSQSGSLSLTSTGTITQSSSITDTVTQSSSWTSTASATSSSSLSQSMSATSSSSHSGSSSPTSTGTTTQSSSISGTVTQSSSGTRSGSGSTSMTASSSRSQSVSSTASPTQSGSSSPTSTGTMAQSSSVTAIATQSSAPSLSASASHSLTESGSSSQSSSSSSTSTGTITISSSLTVSITRSASSSYSTTESGTASASTSWSHSTSQTESFTGTSTSSPSESLSPSTSTSATPSLTEGVSASKTSTRSETSSVSISVTPSSSTSTSQTPTMSMSASASLSGSGSATSSGSSSPTQTGTCTTSASTSGTASRTVTPSQTSSRTGTMTSSVSATASMSMSETPSGTLTPSLSPSTSRTPTFSPTQSASPSFVPIGTVVLLDMYFIEGGYKVKGRMVLSWIGRRQERPCGSLFDIQAMYDENGEDVTNRAICEVDGTSVYMTFPKTANILAGVTVFYINEEVVSLTDGVFGFVARKEPIFVGIVVSELYRPEGELKTQEIIGSCSGINAVVENVQGRIVSYEWSVYKYRDDGTEVHMADRATTYPVVEFKYEELIQYQDSDETYVLYVELRDIFGQISTRLGKRIVRDAVQLISLEAVSDTSMIVFRTDIVELVVSAALKVECLNTTAEFSETVPKISWQSDSAPQRLLTTTGFVLVLPKNSLTPGETYTISASASVEDGFGNRHNSGSLNFSIEVGFSDLSVSIDGGGRSVSSTSPVRLTAVTQDPDGMEGIDTFRWLCSCVDQCNDTVSMCPVIGGNDDHILIEPGVLFEGATYQFSVQYSQQLFTVNRTAVSSSLLEVVAGVQLSLKIKTTLSGPNEPISAGQPLGLFIELDDPLAEELSELSENCPDDTFVLNDWKRFISVGWSLYPYISANGTRGTEIYTFSGISHTISRTKINEVIDRLATNFVTATMIVARAQFCGSTITGTSTIIKGYNRQPRLGELSVFPPNGTELTRFKLTTTGWDDERVDTLRYSFYARRAAGEKFKPISVMQRDTGTSTGLPISGEESGIVTVRVDAIDEYGASGSTTVIITVTTSVQIDETEGVDDMDSISEFADKILQDAVDEGSSSLVAVSVDSAVTLMNKNSNLVSDESNDILNEAPKSPLEDCRASCPSKQGRCDSEGVCICRTGWTGSLCNVTALDYCLSQEYCLNGATCDKEGTCICQVGFYGKFCEISQVTLEQRRALRTKLTETLVLNTNGVSLSANTSAKAFDTEVMSSEGITNFVDTLNSVAAAPEELDDSVVDALWRVVDDLAVNSLEYFSGTSEASSEDSEEFSPAQTLLDTISSLLPTMGTSGGAQTTKHTDTHIEAAAGERASFFSKLRTGRIQRSDMPFLTSKSPSTKMITTAAAERGEELSILQLTNVAGQLTGTTLIPGESRETTSGFVHQTVSLVAPSTGSSNDTATIAPPNFDDESGEHESSVLFSLQTTELQVAARQNGNTGDSVTLVSTSFAQSPVERATIGLTMSSGAERASRVVSLTLFNSIGEVSYELNSTASAFMDYVTPLWTSSCSDTFSDEYCLWYRDTTMSQPCQNTTCSDPNAHCIRLDDTERCYCIAGFTPDSHDSLQPSCVTGCSYTSTNQDGQTMETDFCGIHGNCLNGTCICDLPYYGVDCRFKAECAFLEEATLSWETTGCTPTEIFSETDSSTGEDTLKLRCSCNHLTSFGNFRVPRILAPDFSAFATLNSDNFLIVAILGLAVVVYIVALVWGIRYDHRQRKRVIPFLRVLLARVRWRLEKAKNFEEEDMTFKERVIAFPKEVWHGMLHDHMLVSYFFKKPANSFTRPQRLTIIVVTIVGTLGGDALLSNAQLEYVTDYIIVGLIAGALVFPICYGIRFLFAHTQPYNEVDTYPTTCSIENHKLHHLKRKVDSTETKDSMTSPEDAIGCTHKGSSVLPENPESGGEEKKAVRPDATNSSSSADDANSPEHSNSRSSSPIHLVFDEEEMTCKSDVSQTEDLAEPESPSVKSDTTLQAVRSRMGSITEAVAVNVDAASAHNPIRASTVALRPSEPREQPKTLSVYVEEGIQAMEYIDMKPMKRRRKPVSVAKAGWVGLVLLIIDIAICILGFLYWGFYWYTAPIVTFGLFAVYIWYLKAFLIKPRRSVGQDQRFLPPYTMWITYIVSVVFILFGVVCVMAYGLQFEETQRNNWLLGTLFGIGQDFFIVEIALIASGVFTSLFLGRYLGRVATWIQTWYSECGA